MVSSVNVFRISLYSKYIILPAYEDQEPQSEILPPEVLKLWPSSTEPKKRHESAILGKARQPQLHQSLEAPTNV